MIKNELSVGASHNLVQAGVISGGVHVHLSRRSSRPASLPPAPRIFVDRDEIWKELCRLCAPQSAPGIAPAVQITGPAGVGKTALAVRYLHHHRARFSDGQALVRLGGSHLRERVTVPQALRDVITQLGIPAEETPTELGSVVAMFRSVTSDLAVALLLQDAPATADIDLLLPASPTAAVIVTAREPVVSLDNLHVPALQLAPLEARHSRQLLDEIVRRPIPDYITRQLLAHTRGMPEALGLVGAWLRRHSSPVQQWDLDAFLSGPRLPIDPRNTMTPPEPADDPVALAWESLAPTATTTPAAHKASGRAAQRLHILLGLWPGRQIDADLVRALAADSADGAPDVTAPADLLVDAGLLHEVAGRAAHLRQFAMSDAVHAHAVRAVSATQLVSSEEKSAAVRVMCDYMWVRARHVDELVTPYRQTVYMSSQPAPQDYPFRDDRQDALDWMDEHRHILFDLARLAHSYGHHAEAVQLCDVLWPVHLHRKHRDLRMRADGLGVRAARAWLAQAVEAGVDEETRNTIIRENAAMMKRLGRGLVRRDRQGAATKWLAFSLTIYQAIDDEPGVASVRTAIADQQRYCGEAELVRARTNPVDRTRHLTAAADALDQARVLFAEVLEQRGTHGSPRQVALGLLNLGDAHLALARAGKDPDANLDLAARHLRDAYIAFTELADADIYNAARVQQALGHLHLLRGAIRAKSLLDEALPVFADSNPHETERTLLLLADTARLAGAPQEEVHYLITAQQLRSTRAQPPDPEIAQRLTALDPPAPAASESPEAHP